MRRIPLFVLILALASPALAQRPATQEPAHLAAARDLAARIGPGRTNYEHGEPRIVWTGDVEARVDCSGLVDALLTHCYGYSPDQFKLWFDSRRPTARRYYDEIVRGHGFQRIERIADAAPGDLLAVKYVVKSPDQVNTGHLMVLAAPARRIAASAPIIAGTEQWAAPIIDSSSSPHGEGDTRRSAGGEEYSGVGSGTLRLYSNAAGAVVGFTWTLSHKSTFRGSDERPLAIGRLTPDYQPTKR